VAYDCNPSYLGSRDQEDQGLKPAQANNSWNPISKKPITKRAGGVAQDEGPEFQPQYCKKKKEIFETSASCNQRKTIRDILVS
jgi:hypothetical protein